MTSSMKLIYLAQLAEASYADLADPNNVVSALKIVGFSQTKADELAKNWKVVSHQPNTSSGYSGTLFEYIGNDPNSGFTNGQQVFAQRGTEPTDMGDVNADLHEIVQNGLAFRQIIDMYNYWQRLIAPEGATVREARLVVADILNLTADKIIYESIVPGSPAGLYWTVEFENLDNAGLGKANINHLAEITGHSLGGHLADAFVRLFGGEALTVNGAGYATGLLPGIGLTAGMNIPSLFAMLGGSVSFPSTNIQNLFGSKNFNLVTENGYGLYQVGATDPLFIEQSTLLGNAIGHGAGQMTDSLAVANLFIQLDSNVAGKSIAQALAIINNLLEEASNQRANSLEKTVIAFKKIILGIADAKVETDNQEALYAALKTIQDSAEFKDLVGKVTISSSPPSASNARDDFGAFLSVYYLTPFSIKVTDAGALDKLYKAHGDIADQWSDDRNLTSEQINNSKANFTNQWIEDRIKFLGWSMQLNAEDKSYGLITDHSNEWTFKDVASDYQITIGSGITLYQLFADKHFITFGSDTTADELLGEDASDHFYGGGGNDTLSGAKGIDWLEGNDGDDSLTGGKGSDTLYGGSGDDTYLHLKGDGNDLIVDGDGIGKIKIDGDLILTGGTQKATNLWQSADNKVRYSLFDESDGSKTLNIFISNERLFVKNWEDGFLGISLPETQSPTQPSNLTGNIDIYSAADNGVLIDALGGNDILHGNNGNDTIYAGEGNDFVDGGLGENLIDGGAGNDLIAVNSFGLTVSGPYVGNEAKYDSWAWSPYPNGEDTYNGTKIFYPDHSFRYWDQINDNIIILPHVTMDGVNGNILDFSFVVDPIEGRSSTIFGGSGDDMIFASASDDYIDGGSGNDALLGAAGTDIIFGGDGDDQIAAGQGNDAVDGGSGSDHMIGEYGDDYLNGGADADILTGDLPAFADTGKLPEATDYALLGNDTLDGGEGNDLLFGGGGQDSLVGGDGDDTVYGDDQVSTTTQPAHANDYLNGGNGNDSLVGFGGADTIFAEDGNDSLYGDQVEVEGQYQGNDYLDGGDGNDQAVGSGGADTLIGGVGDDSLFGDANDVDAQYHGNDVLDGGEGNDSLVGEGGADTLSGGDGADKLFGDASDVDSQYHGDDVLDGGDGNDTLVGSAGADSLMGGNGNDQLTGDASDLANQHHAADTMDGGDGDDTIWGGGGNDSLVGGSGKNYLYGDAGNDTVVGGADDEQLVGGEGDDSIEASAGNDSIFGDEGNDTLSGGDGDDQIVAGDGNNQISAGNGNDSVWGGSGNELLDGGAGDDFLQGGAGDDAINGGAGNDGILAGAGNDIIDAGSGNNIVAGDEGDDVITAAGGNDLLEGGAGNDVVTAGAGSDTLYGNDGDDILDAGDGDDLIISGTGNDTVIGGAGKDTYVFNSGDGVKHIVDSGSNILQLSGYTFDDILLGLGSLKISFKNSTDEIHLDNFDPNNFSAGAGIDQFIFDNGVVKTYDELLQGGFYVLGTSGNDSLTGSFLSETIIGRDGNDTLSGEYGDDTLIGGSGNDLMIGNFGNDVFTGGSGQDTAIGGIGNDIYQASDNEDQFIENPDEGVDAVESSISYTLQSPNIENLTLTGNADINGTGDDFANTITGNDGNNTLDGRGGNDILIGGAGDDSYILHDYSDYILEMIGGGSDTIITDISFTLDVSYHTNVENITLIGDQDVDATGNQLNNTLTGNTGNNTLNGQLGLNTLIGGQGNDIYFVADNLDQIVELEDEGYDKAITQYSGVVLADNVEELQISAKYGYESIAATGNSSDNLIISSGIEFNRFWLYGIEGDDTLIGDEGTDVLDGGDGVDVLIGGNGWDYYTVDSSEDQVVELENEGQDSVISKSFTYTLSQNVENLQLIETALEGFGNDLSNQIEGNGHNNLLVGNGGNDTLIDGGGLDTLIGGSGDDFYQISNSDVHLIENQGEGQDTVFSAYSFTLSDHIEALYLGDSAFYGYGNAEDNLIHGSDSDNYLAGLSGNDTLVSGEGMDTMLGGQGNDTYYVYNLERLIEADGEGVDTVIMQDGSGFYLQDNIENLTFLGDNNSYGYGNILDNQIFGNYGSNSLYGLSGNDTLNGYEERDFLYGDLGNDLLLGGDDRLGGMAEEYGFKPNDDYLDGGAGLDTLDGGNGKDTLYGGDDDDLLYGGDDGVNYFYREGDGYGNYSGSNDFLSGGTGNDTLDGGTGSDLLYGDEGSDIIYGGGDLGDRQRIFHDSDTLDGGAGLDTMYGGAGDDIYYVDGIATDVQNAPIVTDCGSTLDGGISQVWQADTIVENTNEGYDIVYTTASLTLSENIEELVLAGEGNLNGTGNDQDNLIFGNAWDNVLDGGAGDDVLLGGAGSDTYVLDTEQDLISEVPDEGIDTVISKLANYQLGENLENVTIQAGVVGASADGNAQNNIIRGNESSNFLNGWDGEDTIYGGAGDDVIDGGNDSDLYVFKPGDGHDVIYDWDGISDTLYIANQVIPADVRLSVGNNQSDLIVELVSTGDTIRLPYWFAFGGVEYITFCDGTIWDTNQITTLAYNTPPTAINDSGSANEDDGVVVFNVADLLANDSDPDPNQTLKIVATTLSAAGVVVTLENQQIVYELGAEFQSLGQGDSITDTFTYTVSDSAGAISTATVELTISGTNDGPVAVEDTATAHEDEGSITIAVADLMANDFDVDAGDSISLVEFFPNSNIQYINGNFVYAVSDGFNYLAEGMTAIDDFYYYISDSFGEQSAAQVKVTIVGANDAPIAAGELDDQTANAGTEFYFEADPFIYDVDEGDVLSYTVRLSDGSALPSWLVFDADNFIFSGNPSAGDIGSNTVVITATDLHGASASVSFDLLVTDQNDGVITGTGGNDTLYGTDNDDVIDGLAGGDVMIGGKGDDVYYVDTQCSESDSDCNGHGNEGLGNGYDAPPPGHDYNWNDYEGAYPGHRSGRNGRNHSNWDRDHHDDQEACMSDQVVESADQGIDTVVSSVTYTLGDHLENLVLTGSENLDGSGNALANNIVGSDGDNKLNGDDGNDTLDGGLGADSLYGGKGDDVYYVNSRYDYIEEKSSQGVDTVIADFSYRLGNYLETLVLNGNENINGYGNRYDNSLFGNIGNNLLDGANGVDLLEGGGGNDTLIGGLGNDTLFGDIGADVFVFNSDLESKADYIQDFVSGEDTIQLDNAIFKKLKYGDLNASNYVIGTKALDSNDYIIYNKSNGGLYYDADGGSNKIKMIQIATLTDHADLFASDINVI